MLRFLSALAFAAVVAFAAAPANAEQASVPEQEAGCPAALPVFKVANTNVVVLDRSNLTKDCLRAIYEQNGDDQDDDEDDC